MTKDEVQKIESIILDDASKVSYEIRGKYILRFFLWMGEKNYSYRTCKEYQRYIYSLLGDPYILSVQKVNKFLDSNTGTSSLMKQASVKMFIRFLLNNYNIVFPKIDYERIKLNVKSKPPAPTRKEVELVIKEFYKDSKENNQFMSHDYSFFIELLFITGARIGELLNMKIMDLEWVDWKEDETKSGIINFRKTKSKRDGKVPIPPSFMHKIRKYIRNSVGDFYAKDNRFLFNFGYENMKGSNIIEKNARYIKTHSKNIQKKLKEISLKAIKKNITPHSLRAARATDLDNKGIPISKIRDFLRHANISTTSRYIVSSLKDLDDELKEKDGFWS